MCGPSNKSSNSTTQIDAKQQHTTTIEQDISDSSEGKLTAGGDITIESTEVATAAIDANAELQEAFAREQRHMFEEQQATLRDALAQSSNVSETAIQEASQLASSTVSDVTRLAENVVEETAQASQQATEAVSDIAARGFDFAQNVVEENTLITKGANETVSSVVSQAFSTNENNFQKTLNFLEEDGDQDRAVIQSSLEALTNNVKNQLEVTETSVTKVFESNTAGILQSVQKTMLIGAAIIAAVAVAIGRKK